MKISWITLVGVLDCCTSAFCCLKSFLDDEGPLKLDPLTEPLFKNDSVKEFLQVCGGKKYLTNDTEVKESISIEDINYLFQDNIYDPKLLFKYLCS